MTTISESRRPFLPGMGVDWLLPLYDPFTRLLGLDRPRRDLLLQADLRPGHRVLDIGCGTGSLVVLVKQLFPDADVVGLDPDEKALARATRKGQRAGTNIQFDCGFSDAMRSPTTPRSPASHSPIRNRVRRTVGGDRARKGSTSSSPRPIRPRVH